MQSFSAQETEDCMTLAFAYEPFIRKRVLEEAKANANASITVAELRTLTKQLAEAELCMVQLGLFLCNQIGCSGKFQFGRTIA